MGVVISLVINGLLVILSFNHPELGPEFQKGLGLFMLVFWLISLVGTILYANTKNKKAAILATVGFALFVPIGLIGVISMRNQMDRDTREKFVEEEKK